MNRLLMAAALIVLAACGGACWVRGRFHKTATVRTKKD